MTDLVADASGRAVYLSVVAAREAEIKFLDAELGGVRKKGNTRTYQQLPRHMQRRALSTNPKRLPRALQARHRAEVIPKKEVSSKRKLRTHRPRPRDLSQDYTRRQEGDGQWMETHVWHAKRFHMRREWGHAIPARPTNKMYRPILRALDTRCIAQDVSWQCPVEVRGSGPLLLEGLSQLLSGDGRAVLRSCYTESLCWASLTLYSPNRCPYGAITDVDLHWQSSRPATAGEKSCGECRCAWLWTHPSATQDVLDALSRVFSLQPVAANSVSSLQPANAGSCCVRPLVGNEQEINASLVKSQQSTGNDINVLRNEDTENVPQAFISEDTAASMETNDQSSNSDSEDEGINCESGDQHDNNNITKKSKTKTINENPYQRELRIKTKALRRHKFLIDKLSRGDNNPDFINHDTGVSLEILKGQLNRFILRGPEARAVLQRVLQPTSVIPVTSNDLSNNGNAKTSVKNPNKYSTACRSEKRLLDAANGVQGSRWWAGHYEGNGSALAGHEHNSSMWRQPSSRLPRGCVLGLTVRDPRVTMPQHRYKQSPLPAVAGPGVAAVYSDCTLYDRNVRLSLLLNARSNCEVNRQRSEAAIPGSVLPLTDAEDRLPVLLLTGPANPTQSQQDSAHPTPDEGESISVVVPGGFGGAVWQCVVQCGAVAVGDDTTEHLVLEEVTPCPAHQQPDTPSGRNSNSLVAEERRRSYFLLPPDKRPNYIKLNTQFPFSQPWERLLACTRQHASKFSSPISQVAENFAREVLDELKMDVCEEELRETPATVSVNDGVGSDNLNRKLIVKDTNNQVENLCVIRNRSYLNALDALVCPSGIKRRIFRAPIEAELDNTTTGPSSSGADGAIVSREQLLGIVGAMQRDPTTRDGLLRVTITIMGKGVIEPCAVISAPSAQDLSSLPAVLSASTTVAFAQVIQETMRPDYNEGKRKLLKKQHKTDLARLQRLRSAARRRAASSGTDAASAAVRRVEQQEAELVSRCAAYSSAHDRLWLPDSSPMQHTRRPLGYCTHAAFSRKRGCGAGQGYVTLTGLLDLLQDRLQSLRHTGSSRLSEGVTLVGGATDIEGGATASAPTDIVQDSGIVVLLRNPASLIYRFAVLNVCVPFPPS